MRCQPKLQKALEARGYSCFVGEKQLEGGDEWASGIARAVLGCRAFLSHLRYPLYTHSCVLIAYRVIGMSRCYANRVLSDLRDDQVDISRTANGGQQPKEAGTPRSARLLAPMGPNSMDEICCLADMTCRFRYIIQGSSPRTKRLRCSWAARSILTFRRIMTGAPRIPSISLRDVSTTEEL